MKGDYLEATLTNGKVYLVATPIGNLGDISLRALETLKKVDVIACEDTRHSLKLLNSFEIKKTLISCHKFNEAGATSQILRLVAEGKEVAVISDAGMPCVSDPGSYLVNQLREKGVEYTVIPGASALPCAVALTGIEAPFTFIGFLPDNKKDRERLLSPFTSVETALIFYAAPHDLNKVLDSLYKFFGDRKLYLVKEISKIHEDVIEGELAVTRIDEPKGEYVVVLEKPKRVETEVTDNDILDALIGLINEGTDKKSAVTETAKSLKVGKNRVYKLAESIK